MASAFEIETFFGNPGAALEIPFHLSSLTGNAARKVSEVYPNPGRACR